MSDRVIWSEKYRPTRIDDIKDQTHVTSTLKNLMKSNSFPHLLFHGQPGTGKTTTIHACVNELYGDNKKYMVLELNASDDRGIEVVRNRIKRFISTASYGIFGGIKDMFKLVILDEVDIMTGDAQAILQKIIEDYTYNARFCLICNHIKNINHALQSRCCKFRFNNLSHTYVKNHIIEIVKQENLNIDRKTIMFIINNSNNDLRRIYNILQMFKDEESIDNEMVKKNFGYLSNNTITNAIDFMINKPFSACVDNILRIESKYNVSLNDIISRIYDVIITDITDNESMDMPFKLKLNALKEINNINKNLFKNTDEFIQICHLVSLFKD
jgi:replication factor C subunit 3/5